MKMLIAQEMSKEVDSSRSPPNLVAKLMGLDSLPQKEPDSSIKRSQHKGHPHRHSDVPTSNWEQHNGSFPYLEQDKGNDVYEIWKQSQKSTRKGRCDETTNAKNLALFRLKFDERKRLSTYENLRQSKQFRDTKRITVLKGLQEPNSALSQQLYNLQTIPPPETKRITVLRPSKMADNFNFPGAENEEAKQMGKGSFVKSNDLDRRHLGDSTPSSWESFQPTRIVVLKPIQGKLLDDKDVASRIHSGEFFEHVEDEKNREPKEVAQAITQQTREKLGRLLGDETLISSVFSNGYVADESSLSSSEIEYPVGYASDLEVMLPVSRHSWEFANRLGNQYSTSSFSRASYSLKSSVRREAKKHLPNRWTMMASSGSCPEQRQISSSFSTLGEILALSETKKIAVPGEEGSSNQEPKSSIPLLFTEHRMDRDIDNSTRNVMRSKSGPVSSTKIGVGLDSYTYVSEKDKVEFLKDTKEKGVKSSFKGKVSSLFFSRSKKSSKDKSSASETTDEPQSCSEEIVNDKTGIGLGYSSVAQMESSNKASFSNLNFKQIMTLPETLPSVSEPIVSLNHIEDQDQDQRSLVYLSDQPFEEYQFTPKLVSHYVEPDRNGSELTLNRISSNLIHKSPTIGSVVQTLSWYDSSMGTASSYPVKESFREQATGEGEQEWCLFVETLLSAAGLGGEVEPESFLARWHSTESPLNPLLRDKYIDLNDKVVMHEAERRQNRSMQKLVFDCVNTVLVEIGGESRSLGIVEEVWARLGVWFSGERTCTDVEALEMMVREEVVGKRWFDDSRGWLEGMVLEELVGEAVLDMTGAE